MCFYKLYLICENDKQSIVIKHIYNVETRALNQAVKRNI